MLQNKANYLLYFDVILKIILTTKNLPKLPFAFSNLENFPSNFLLEIGF